VKTATDPAQTVLAASTYAYDPGGNRTAEQIGDQVIGASYNNLNRLVSQQPAGPLGVAGTMSEPAAVTVNGLPAVVTPDQQFRAAVPVTPGTNLLTVTAVDPSGNATSRQWEVDSTGAGRTFTYDTNGNLTADGTRTFEWDARNQLVAVNVGTHRSEFTYNGEHQRVRVVEKQNGAVQSDIRVLWCEDRVCEERDGVTQAVIRRAFQLGEAVAGSLRFSAADHLGTVVSVTNASAGLITQYAFDPWGRRGVTAGADATEVGFTGHEWDSTASVWLTQYRGYDPTLGRWLSEDPSGMVDGPSLYAYVTNRPTQAVDPFGLQLYVPGPPPSEGPPLGCQAAGPWTYLTHGLLDKTVKPKWEQDWQFDLKARSSRTRMPTGAGSVSPGICWVYYKQVGVIEVVRTFEDWQRPITCCGQKSTQYARTIQTSVRDVPYMDDGRIKRTAVRGVMADGKCFTGQRGPR
jgi:RHS repeat-associated protein